MRKGGLPLTVSASYLSRSYFVAAPYLLLVYREGADKEQIRSRHGSDIGISYPQRKDD